MAGRAADHVSRGGRGARCTWWCASTARYGRSRRSSAASAARSTGAGSDPRQPPGRLGVRRRRSVERIRRADGARAQPGPPRARRVPPRAHDRARQLGRRGVHAHLLDGMGRTVRRGAAAASDCVHQRGQCCLGTPVHRSGGAVAQPVAAEAARDVRDPRSRQSRRGRRRARRERGSAARCPTRRGRSSSTTAWAAAAITRCS